jgi:hypothetical protein
VVGVGTSSAHRRAQSRQPRITLKRLVSIEEPNWNGSYCYAYLGGKNYKNCCMYFLHFKL